MQGYLTSNELNTDDKQLLFHFRTRTFNCKSNYKTQYGSDLSCFICKEVEDQQHMLSCKTLVEDIELGDTKYEDLFGPTEKQIKITKTLKRIISKRNILMKKSSMNGSQVHP